MGVHGKHNLLRECRVILPAFTQKGLNVDHSVQPWLEHELTKQFGGFTSMEGRGAYTFRNGSVTTQAILIYDVALFERDYTKLVLIALGIRQRADQETVYIRDPFGRTFIGSDAYSLTAGVDDL